jgi:hypothetical protein
MHCRLVPRTTSAPRPTLNTIYLRASQRHTFNMTTQSATEKNQKFGHLPLSTSGPQVTTLTVRSLRSRTTIKLTRKQGNALLQTPYFNKGSAFTKEERGIFKLHGLLPTNVQSLDEQVQRAYAQYSSRPNDLAKNTFMTSLKEQNEVLYYKVDHSPSSGSDQAVADKQSAHPRPSEGNVLRHIHTDRGRCDRRLLASV